MINLVIISSIFILTKYVLYIKKCNRARSCGALKGRDGASKFTPSCRKGMNTLSFDLKQDKTKLYWVGVKTPFFRLPPPPPLQNCHPYLNVSIGNIKRGVNQLNDMTLIG